MPNLTITNKQSSILSLAPLLDTAGDVLVLQPKGSKGDEKPIDEETANHEIVERICKAGWATVRAVSAAQPSQEPPAPAPVAATPPPAPEPAPAPVPEPAPLPEPTMEMPKDVVEALVEETKPPIETSMPVETSTSSETPTPPSRSRRR
jgi:hypothetical protein